MRNFPKKMKNIVTSLLLENKKVTFFSDMIFNNNICHIHRFHERVSANTENKILKMNPP